MAPRRGLQTVVLLALWGLLTHGTYAGSGDEPHYLAIAHSIAFDGDFDLTNNYGAAEPLVGAGVLRPDAHVRTGVDGTARPVHDIGMPLLFAPVVRVLVPLTHLLTNVVPASAMRRARLTPPILYRHLLSLVMACLAAMLAGQMFDAFAYLDATPSTAAAMTALLVLSPPLLIFSILFFTELLSALLAFAVLASITFKDAPGQARWWWLGCAAGGLFLIHARNIGPMFALASIALHRLGLARRREAIAFAAGVVVLVIIRTIVNMWFWGDVVSGPHAHLGSWLGLFSFFREMTTRILAMLIDQEYGLFIYAPVYLAWLAGGFGARTAAKGEFTVAATLTASAYVAFVVSPLTNPYGWSGGWSPAARFLTPVLPLLGLAVYSGLQKLPKAASAFVIALQIALSAYTWQHPKLLWNDGDGRAAFCKEIGERVCDYLPSFLRHERRLVERASSRAGS